MAVVTIPDACILNASAARVIEGATRRAGSRHALACDDEELAMTKVVVAQSQSDLPDGQKNLRARKPVQPFLQKHFSSRQTQIKLTIRLSRTRKEGRLAIVTDVGGGMRWTHIAGRSRCATSGVCADGEVVWFWRSNAGAK
jgi:hypothetical protein